MNDPFYLDDTFHSRRCHAEEVMGFYQQHPGPNDRSVPTSSAIFDISITHNCEETAFPLSDVNKIKRVFSFRVKSFQEAQR